MLMLNYTNFYMLKDFVMTPYLQIHHKIEGIERNPTLRVGKIRRNAATMPLAKFFACVNASSIGFQWVVVPAIGSFGKGAVDDRRSRIYKTFFLNFSPHVTDSPFQTYRTERKMNGSLHIWRRSRSAISSILSSQESIESIEHDHSLQNIDQY